jgi:hypothetical protein
MGKMSFELCFSPMGTFIRSLLFSFLFTEAFHGVEILDLQSTATEFKIKRSEDYEIFYADGTGKWKIFDSLYTITVTEFGLKEYSLDKATTMDEYDLYDDFD